MTSRTSTQPGARNTPEAQRLLDEGLASVRDALSGLRFGSVSITVHEGRVVQIDVTEKRRLVPN
ncbi:MAG TPA: YezD family protein [Sphingomonadaceae bacterium]|nr:YezD family protein [Sphingomonadaceae bacterium]